MNDSDAPFPVAPVAPVLGEKYRLGRVIGRGGMSVVYEGEHTRSGQSVAIKVLNKGSGYERVLLEAQAAAHLRSEHVVRVFDVGVAPGGEPYVVMEKLVGHDLADLVASVGPLAIADAAAFVLQACEALAEAHAKKIVHRDLKPSNLFLTRRPDGSPCIKVLDFGLVHRVESAFSSSRMAGSPGYASPEQLGVKERIDGRADVWAIGVVLFELVTGARPFPAETLADALLSIVSVAVPRMESPRGPVPAAFEALVRKCLEREPENRWQSIVDVAVGLVPFAGAAHATYAARVRKASLSADEAATGTPMATAMDVRSSLDSVSSEWVRVSTTKHIAIGADPAASSLVAAEVMSGRMSRTRIVVLAAAALLLSVPLVAFALRRSASGPAAPVTTATSAWVEPLAASGSSSALLPPLPAPPPVTASSALPKTHAPAPSASTKRSKPTTSH